MRRGEERRGEERRGEEVKAKKKAFWLCTRGGERGSWEQAMREARGGGGGGGGGGSYFRVRGKE
eukprot:763370-Hanusia_phi.AAC.2